MHEVAQRWPSGGPAVARRRQGAHPRRGRERSAEQPPHGPRQLETDHRVMQHEHDAATPEVTPGPVGDTGPLANGIHAAWGAAPAASQPSLMSLAFSPRILSSEESRRAIMFQRAPRLGLERLARFVQLDLDV